ncbi:MAG: hypothetical protein K1X87_12445 [Dehalococcoidia bacterium]|nr:hypothetical protein [Dehalococcoidia bacterium]
MLVAAGLAVALTVAGTPPTVEVTVAAAAVAMAAAAVSTVVALAGAVDEASPEAFMPSPPARDGK